MAKEAFKPLVDIAKGVTDSAFIVDRQRHIVEFNRSFVKLHAVPHHQVRSMREQLCRSYVNMEICEKNCIVFKCVESGATVRYDEVVGKSASGDPLNLIVTAIPIRDDAGEIVSVLEMHRDVTDEAKIHEKYKVLLEKEQRAKEELERLVEERTRELSQAYQELKRAEAQLVHSEKMSSLGQMVAGIAHELNNPINFIHGNVDLIEEYARDLRVAVRSLEKLTEGNPEIRARVKSMAEEMELDFKTEDLVKIGISIRKGSERAAEIIQGLRTFSRLDEAKAKESDLHEGIDTSLTLLRNRYKDRVRIHREYGHLPLIHCYASQLNQVFMNLLHNAIQAIPGEGDIWIRTSEDGEKNVTIEIEDSGAGIAPEHLKKIFDPFFTTKPVGQGTGLGLSISHGVIERHGGQIEVRSVVGKGTCFRVTIPKTLQGESHE